MPDAIDRLESFDPGPGALPGPLPAAQVRRLGERRRRRSTALVGLGAAVAIAAVVTPITLLGSSGSDGSQGPIAPAGSVSASPTPSSSLTPSGAPSPTSSVDPSPSQSPEGAEVPSSVPADFPLASGLPDDADAEPGADFGLTGPARDVTISPADVCGETLRIDPPGVSDRLAVTWSNPEDGRDRLLISFGTADEAVAYVDRLVQQVRGCPREPGTDGSTVLNEVLPTQVGGQSVALVFGYEKNGSVGIHRSIYHVIRLGKAVLVDYTYNEGGGGPDPVARNRAQVDAQIAASADVVAAMCRFTRAGCSTTG